MRLRVATIAVKSYQIPKGEFKLTRPRPRHYYRLMTKTINQLEIAELLLEINNVLSKVIDDPNAYIGRETFFKKTRLLIFALEKNIPDLLVGKEEQINIPYHWESS